MATNGTTALEAACKSGIDILDELMGTNIEERSRFEGKALSPSFLASSKCLVFLHTGRAGLFAGGTFGDGFAIAKSSSGSWTSPCFVRLRKFELGAFFGYQSSKTLMSGLTKSSVQAIIDNEYTSFGTDVTVQLWPASSGVDDQVSVNYSDFVSASCSTGILFDFSLSGGSLKVDDAKNAEVYGEGVTASQLLNGQVEKPKEMIPLYQKITSISRDALK